MELMPHQLDVLDRLKNGNILFGLLGSGKTITSLGYYMKNEAPKNLYVITTAKKRDSLDWETEAAAFGIGKDITTQGKLHVDSWNNIGKYVGVSDAFFIFDEQRLIGSGAWVKAFYKIAKRNNWIILSGTPGDVWLDYAPVFIANGFYENISEFKMNHVRYGRHKFPKVLGYLGVKKLERLRDEVLVEMEYVRHTERIINHIDVSYDEEKYKDLIKRRWNPWTDKPMIDGAELLRCLRRLVNSDESRLDMVRKFLAVHERLIVFYNFNYELEILRTLADEGITVREWNGHRKHPLPDVWDGVYLVQYVAGAEGWNCITTDAMMFYTLTYSFKNFVQSQGRIDRLNTPYTKLYYYVLRSDSSVDRQIWRSLGEKRNFNEKAFIKSIENGDENECFEGDFSEDITQYGSRYQI